MGNLLKPTFLILLMIICVDFNNGTSTSTTLSETLVSFGDLEEVRVNYYELREVEDIERDLLNPGGFIVGDGNSVIRIFSNMNVTNIAGHVLGTASTNGVGSDAYFNGVQDILPIDGGREVLVADLKNHCIRKVDTQTRVVSTFAGICGRAVPLPDKSSLALKTVLEFPQKIIANEEENTFYYLLHDRVVKHDMLAGTITPVIPPGQMKDCYSFVMDSTKRYMYVSHASNPGISLVDLTTKLVVPLADQTPGYKTEDKTLLSSFPGLTDITWLIEDQVLVAAESSSSSLIVVNILDRLVSTICTDIGPSSLAYRLGSISECMIKKPWVVQVIDEYIYTAAVNGPFSQPYSYMLRLPFYQLVCSGPNVTNNISYSPVKERYYHGEEVEYKCSTGYGIVNSSSAIRKCVREMDLNGKVIGRWSDVPPECGAINVISVSPTRGQRSGGTTITVNGTLPAEVNVYVGFAGNFSQQITSIKYFVGRGVEFQIPAYEEESADKKDCLIQISSLDGNVYKVVHYQYLPNPHITSISRTSAIVSGGVTIEFNGTNMSSAHSYSLQFHLSSADNSSSQQFGPSGPCTLTSTGDSVSCIIPDLEEAFKIYKTPGSDELNLTAVLIGDSKPIETHITSSAQIPFTIQNVQPSFKFDPNIRPTFHVETDKMLIVKGDNLNTSLLPADYKVYLVDDDVSTIIPCNVVELLEKELKCEPIFNQSYLSIQSTDTWPVSIEVQVGKFNLSAGYLTFSNEPLATNTPNHKRPLKTGLIAVGSIVGCVLVISGICYAVYSKFQKPLDKLPSGGFSSSSTAVEETHWQENLPLELKMAVKDMYIDPSTLSFSFKAHEIGRGHFGKVYIGQLLHKGDTLKTVAVKTLRETADVNLDQIIEFLNEAVFTKDYKHINILSTLGIAWREGDRPLVVLPYMALGDLHSLVSESEKHNFSHGDLLHFGFQVAAGMEFLVGRRCLHRDLAARNCLVDEQYIVKIADFGMSKDVYSQDQFTIDNTDQPLPLRWMALETLTSGVYTAETEVWSFGVLIWELFTAGSTPYPGISSHELTMHLQAGNRLHKPPEMHQSLFTFISKCWLADKHSRPTFNCIKNHFNQLLFAAAMIKETDEVTHEEPFQYSYARQFTQSIPEGYEFYLELSLSDSGYLDITSPSPGGTEYKYGTSNTNTGAYVLTDDLEVVDYTDVRSSGRIFSEVSIECDSNNTQKQKNSLDSSRIMSNCHVYVDPSTLVIM